MRAHSIEVKGLPAVVFGLSSGRPNQANGAVRGTFATFITF